MRFSLAILALLSSCGADTQIVLEVVSDLAVPEQVDGLEIVLSSPVDGNELRTVSLELNSNHNFPIEVSFTPGDNTPNVLEGRITGELGDTAVAQIEVAFNWQPGKLNRVELFPLEPL